jgi:hypothetical protein
MHIYEVLITELHNENRGFYFEQKKKKTKTVFKSEKRKVRHVAS